jgi:hypothetical protein
VYPEQENEVFLPLCPGVPWAPCKARWVWASEVAIFFWAMCSLHFAKTGSATALSQQKKDNSADLQRG